MLHQIVSLFYEWRTKDYEEHKVFSTAKTSSVMIMCLMKQQSRLRSVIISLQRVATRRRTSQLVFKVLIRSVQRLALSRVDMLQMSLPVNFKAPLCASARVCGHQISRHRFILVKSRVVTQTQSCPRHHPALPLHSYHHLLIPVHLFRAVQQAIRAPHLGWYLPRN